MEEHCANCLLVNCHGVGDVFGFAYGHTDVSLHCIGSTNILVDVEPERFFCKKSNFTRIIYFSCSFYERSDWCISTDTRAFCVVVGEKGVEDVSEILEWEDMARVVCFLCSLVFCCLLGRWT